MIYLKITGAKNYLIRLVFIIFYNDLWKVVYVYIFERTPELDVRAVKN
jgi:hypothetical protein